MRIIQYTDEWKELIYLFFKETFKENNREFLPYGKDSDICNIKDHYMNDGNFWCLLNKYNKICGTIALRKISDYYEIRRFFIRKKYQGCGYGNYLFNTLMNYAIEHNYQLIRAATMFNGYAAQHIFLYNGFTKTKQYNNSSADLFFEFEITLTSSYEYRLNYLRKTFKTSLILNPTENIPYKYKKTDTDFLEGLYVSERFKDVNDKVIFAGRNDYISFFQFIKAAWAKKLNAYDVDLKTLSGLNAHLILFLCILKPEDKIIILPEECGGHFATEKILKSIGAKVYQMIPDYKNLCVDSQKTLDIIHAEHINYIFVDRSEGLYYEDFSWVNDCPNSYKIFDASQYISSVICGQFRNPFEMGFDMIITTLHKNYPGPQKGLIAVKKNDYVWNEYLTHAKTYISNTHPKEIADSLLPLLNSNIDEYCIKCSSCIQNLERLLHDYDVPFVKRHPEKTPSQHIWVLCSDKNSSYQYYLKLESLGLLTNYRLLPYKLGFGLRLGLSAAILSGLTEKDIPKLAEIMSEAYHKDITPRLAKKSHKFIHKIKSTEE